jgi:hypothetical protein
MDANFQENDGWTGPNGYATEQAFKLVLSTLRNMLNDTIDISTTLDPVQWIAIRDVIGLSLNNLIARRLPTHYRAQHTELKKKTEELPEISSKDDTQEYVNEILRGITKTITA